MSYVNPDFFYRQVGTELGVDIWMILGKSIFSKSQVMQKLQFFYFNPTTNTVEATERIYIDVRNESMQDILRPIITWCKENGYVFVCEKSLICVIENSIDRITEILHDYGFPACTWSFKTNID